MRFLHSWLCALHIALSLVLTGAVVMLVPCVSFKSGVSWIKLSCCRPRLHVNQAAVVGLCLLWMVNDVMMVPVHCDCIRCIHFLR